MMSEAWTAEECDLFASALDEAWRYLSETGQIAEEAFTKSAISLGIFKAAELGERSVEVLAAYALAHIEDSKRELQRREGDGESR